MARKRIIVRGHGVWNAGPHESTTWDDVWLRWAGKPGRKTYRAAPCLMSYADLVSEIEFTRGMFEFAPDDAETWQEELDHLLAIKDHLEREPYYTEMRTRFPNTYTRVATIDRAEAERMLTHMLRVRYGVVGDLKFDWRKTRCVVRTV